LIRSRKNETKYAEYVKLLSVRSQEFSTVTDSVLSLMKKVIRPRIAGSKVARSALDSKMQAQTFDTEQNESDILHLTGGLLELRQKDIDRIEELMKVVHNLTMEIAGEVKRHDESLLATARYARKTKKHTEKAAAEIEITAESRRSSARNLYCLLSKVDGLYLEWHLYYS